MNKKVILLVEDNPDDEALSLIALKRDHVLNDSSHEERDVIEGYKLGANSYVRKPVEFTQFAEAVRQLKLYWLVLNEVPPKERGNR